MLSIRLRPVGKRHQRSFRVVVDTARHKLQGKNVEDLGWYNPHTNDYGLKDDRVLHWLDVGAQPTETVHNLLVRARLVRGKKIAVHSQSKKKEEPVDEVKPAETKASEKGTAPETNEEQAPEVKQEDAAPEATTEAEPSEETHKEEKPNEA